MRKTERLLTTPQLSTLHMLERGEFVSSRYKPVDKLFKLGFAQLNIGVKQDKVGISEAGREYLKELRAQLIPEEMRRPDVPMPDGLSPLFQEYWRLRQTLPVGMILVFRLGDFYEILFEDAPVAAEAMGTAVTRRREILMTGIPYHAAGVYLGALVKAGHHVALAEMADGVRVIDRMLHPR